MPVTRTSRRWEFLRFIALFGLLLAIYYVLVLIPFIDRLFYGYLEANAWMSGEILNIFGQHTRVSEVTIRSDSGYAISVRRGCDALETAWFFCAAIIAFPAPFRSKWPTMLAGSAIIFVLNVVRIASLFLIGLQSPGLFESAHLEIWPVVFLLLVLSLWVFWIRSITRTAELVSNVAQ